MENWMPVHKNRYDGKRWRLVFGCYEGIEKFALNELQRAVQNYLPYTLAVSSAGSAPPADDEHRILLGTMKNHPRIRELCAKNIIPEGPEGYGVVCLPGPGDGAKTIVLAGHDAAGVLYAVEDFNARILGLNNAPDDPGKNADIPGRLSMSPISGRPRIMNRGIWTWGYVIYDYRRFLDNMARLRMNMLTLWNDTPPVNMPEIIDYAHERGIKIVLGFHWGWGYDFDLSDTHHLLEVKDNVLRTYQKEYAGLKHDGIYFQTNTENSIREVNGVPRAKRVCQFVNDTGRALLAEYPALRIQFGVHATSIQDDYPFFRDLDERITLVWEDAGVIPYSYEAAPKNAGRHPGLDDFESTLAYSLKISRLREGREFALVPKGFSKLRWDTEFEHHGPFVLGERSESFIHRRLLERKAALDQGNALWLKHYKLAVRFFREIIKAGQDRITATALVEDGLFESSIPFSVALFAQILWDPFTDEDEMAANAMSAYYSASL